MQSEIMPAYRTTSAQCPLGNGLEETVTAGASGFT